MAKKFKTNTNAFSIAHYILLFLVAGFSIAIIAWVMIKNNNPNPANNVSANVIHIKDTDPCVQRTRDMVARMWAYDPGTVPEKYWEIAENYLYQVITTRTYGICQDVAFTCHVGQIRIDCDPCAVPSARDWAQSIHVADLIRKNCGMDVNAHAMESVDATHHPIIE